MSSPNRRTWPADGWRLPAMQLKVVVLPAPFGPISAWRSCAPTRNDTRSTATTPPNALVSPRTSMAGASSATRLLLPGDGAGEPHDSLRGPQDGRDEDGAEED